MMLLKKMNKMLRWKYIEDKIPDITNLATTTALTAVEDKTLDVSNSVIKTDYNTKINGIEKKITDGSHDKYITTPEFNKLTAENFAAKLAQGNLVTKPDFDNKLRKLRKKINLNKAKNFIVEKIETFDLIYFCGKSHFEDDGTQII